MLKSNFVEKKKWLLLTMVFVLVFSVSAVHVSALDSPNEVDYFDESISEDDEKVLEATPDDQKKTDGDDNAKNEKVETDKEDETKEVDKKEKKEKPKKENNKEEKPYTDEQEDGLLESYNEIIDESDGVIQKIEQEDNYDIINVYVDDSFENMPKEQRQEFVDDFGNKIENNTRARLFGAGSDDFKYVYFMNSKQEHVAKTGHLDKSWKVK